MPEFVLDHGTPEAAKEFANLDSFTQGYVTALFWTDANSDSEDLADANYSELSVDALAQIVIDCQVFQTKNMKLLDEYYQHRTASDAGHDFWLTRNGHGTGFWDRDLEKQLGDALTEASKEAGEFSLYRGDDGLVYAE